MGLISRNRYEYLYETEWIMEGALWQPLDVITLRDEAGAVIGSTQMATMLMTIYNAATNAIVNGVDGTISVKNARSCTLSSQGIFVPKLLSADTFAAITITSQVYEVIKILVQYTWPSTPTKSDALEITVAIRNVHRRPYIAP